MLLTRLLLILCATWHSNMAGRPRGTDMEVDSTTPFWRERCCVCACRNATEVFDFMVGHGHGLFFPGEVFDLR